MTTFFGQETLEEEGTSTSQILDTGHMELETRVEAWAKDELEESLVYKVLGVNWKKRGLGPSLEEFKQLNFKQNDTF